MEKDAEVKNSTVTPFAGVWIEICLSFLGKPSTWVTPFAGVWIEISSLTSDCRPGEVTPFAGVWIEMFLKTSKQLWQLCHPLRGGVD